MRDELGLNGGSEVEVSLVDGHIEIESAPGEIRLERAADGRLVAVSDRELPPLTAETEREWLERVRR